MPDRFTEGMGPLIERRKGRRGGTLWADFETGEGDVTLSEAFCEEDLLFQADVLSDWIGCLKAEYKAVKAQLFTPEVKGKTQKGMQL